MCLDYIDKAYLNPIDEEWQIGYKVMVFYGINEEYIYFPFHSILGFSGVIYNKKYEVMQDFIIVLERNDDIIAAYLSGFHIFTDIKSAQSYSKTLCLTKNCEQYIIVKVKYRKVTAIGRQSIYKCVVAREIKFVEIIF
jgi:hypothetical protein